jgi:DNA-binding LytR/AlgR family response regulator
MGAKEGNTMKLTIHIDPDREEEVVIYARENRPVFAEIQRLLAAEDTPLVGYEGEHIVVLKPKKISCFVSGGDKVIAICGEHKYVVKKRLYQLEEQLGKDYIRINQSCLANVGQISRFSASIGGSLEVVFRDGYRDFVSRRELKKVKERMGIV